MELTVARIGRPHGIKGEVTIALHTDDPELRFAPGSKLKSDQESRKELIVEGLRFHSGYWILKFVGIDTRNSAEELRGAVVKCDVDIEEEYEDGSYHVARLIGMKVIESQAEGEKEIGLVSDVLNLPGQDLLVIDSATGEKLIPMVEEIIDDVDLDLNIIRVNIPMGLFEDQEGEKQ
jgi:16S rRNA processing protein RimM